MLQNFVFKNKKNKNLFFGKFKNTLTKRIAYLVFYENALLLQGITPFLVKNQFKQLYNKFRFLQGQAIKRVKNRWLFFKKVKRLSFDNHINSAQALYGAKLDCAKKLIWQASQVKKLILKFKWVSSKYLVGQNIYRILRLLLTNYAKMLNIWYENEQWGFFDANLSLDVRKKLMKYFWLSQVRNQNLKFNLSQRVLGEHKGKNYKIFTKIGYSMRSLKITDNLFFWYVFTKKKIRQNFWLVRSKKFFDSFFLIKKKQMNSKLYLKNLVLSKFLSFTKNLGLSKIFSNCFGFYEKSNILVKNIIENTLLNALAKTFRDNIFYSFSFLFLNVKFVGQGFLKFLNKKSRVFFFFIKFFLFDFFVFSRFFSLKITKSFYLNPSMLLLLKNINYCKEFSSYYSLNLKREKLKTFNQGFVNTKFKNNFNKINKC